MKKLKSVLCSLILLASACTMWACKGDGKNATLESATTSLKSFYHVTETIDWQNVTVTATYSNKSTKQLDKGQFDIEVEDAQADTQWVLKTDGLKAQTAGELTAKTYNMKLYIIGHETPFDISVDVNNDQSNIYNLALFSKPANIAEFERHTASTGDEANPSGFKTVSDAKYYVGDDNGFRITPEYTLKNKSTNATVEGVDLILTVEVRNSENGLVGDSIYTYADGEIDFTEAAIDNTYSIKIIPTYFDKDIAGYDITPVEFDVTVKDGYNAYDALDLGMMSIAPEGVDYTNYRRSSRSAGYDTDKLYYDAVNGGHYNKPHTDVWTEYFQSKGRDASDIYYIKGIYLHANIDITDNDLPEIYFFGEKEAGGTDKLAYGKLRDWTFPYAHIMQDDFNMEGNYFTINASGISVNGGIGFGEKRMYKNTTQVSNFGHSKLFSFLGMSVVSNSAKESNQNVAYVQNIHAIGNTGDVAGATDEQIRLAAGGLIMFQNASCAAVVENININQTMIGWFVEMTDKEESGNSHSQLTRINNANISNCFNSAIFTWCGEGDCCITNSEFARFGGPAMFAVTCENSKTNSKLQAANLSWDDTLIIDNPIAGDEAWFVINGASTIVSQKLTPFDKAFNNCGKTFLDGNNKINLKVLVMDEDYLSADTTNIYSTINDYDCQDQFLLGASEKGAPYLQTNGEVGTNSYLPDNKCMIYASDANNLANATIMICNFTGNNSNPYTPRTTDLTGDEAFLLLPVTNSCRAGLVMDLYDYGTAKA